MLTLNTTLRGIHAARTLCNPQKCVPNCGSDLHIFLIILYVWCEAHMVLDGWLQATSSTPYPLSSLATFRISTGCGVQVDYS